MIYVVGGKRGPDMNLTKKVERLNGDRWEAQIARNLEKTFKHR